MYVLISRSLTQKHKQNIYLQYKTRLKTTNCSDFAKQFRTKEEALKYAPSPDFEIRELMDWDSLPNQSFRDTLSSYQKQMKDEGFQIHEYRDMVNQAIHFKIIHQAWKAQFNHRVTFTFTWEELKVFPFPFLFMLNVFKEKRRMMFDAIQMPCPSVP